MGLHHRRRRRFAETRGERVEGGLLLGGSANQIVALIAVPWKKRNALNRAGGPLTSAGAAICTVNYAALYLAWKYS
jgi:hypothetical protein